MLLHLFLLLVIKANAIILFHLLSAFSEYIFIAFKLVFCNLINISFHIPLQTLLNPAVKSFEVCSVNFGRHFWFSLSLYLEMKILNSLSHILVIWVFHSFSLVLVDEKSLQFLVKLQLPTFISVAILYVVFNKNSNSFFSLRPNQLSIWKIWIKDWIWKNWKLIFIFR